MCQSALRLLSLSASPVNVCATALILGFISEIALANLSFRPFFLVWAQSPHFVRPSCEGKAPCFGSHNRYCVAAAVGLFEKYLDH